MKEYKIGLYRFEELDKEVQDKLIEKHGIDIAGSIMDGYGDDYISVLNEFEKIAHINVGFEISYSGKWYNFEFTDEPCMGSCYGKMLYEDDICGKYLRRWLNRNFLPSVTRAKRYYKGGKKRVSRITCGDWRDCPISGMCYDYCLLKPIMDCYGKPISDNYSLRDLIYDALNNFFDAWEQEYEYWYENKDNCLYEEMSMRYDGEKFFKDGRIFEGIIDDAA